MSAERENPGAAREQERKTTALVWELAEPLCASEGAELIHVEYQREAGGRILRLYIEKPEGVGLDDCTAISRQLSDILDIKLDTEEPYTLEVSSPGPQRPLSRQSDFDRFSGYKAKIKVFRPINGRKNFTGVLEGYSNGRVLLKVDEETIGIEYSEISRARLVDYI